VGREKERHTMTVKERLDNVKKLMDYKLWHKADKEIDAIYEDYCSNDSVEFTEADDDRMFRYIEIISHRLYCERMARM
jgi:hypothetical protein